ncbi:UDP-glycosyltransferase 71E1-like [Coffea eugenioides]|uniref:UDP-glycosyltransferase 71E1-like n=1 Tax=Coffea eugenioides TaxID=49369 RepID=UPI000F611980|nr:UDP-glycosyltransferase 71E1-like [Coffea eugenioides]
MEGRRSRGCGASRGRGVRQAQEPRNERETAAKQDCGPRVEAGDQVATAIQQMTNILTRLVDQQGQIPVNQPQNPEIGENRALERFQKFIPPKFLGRSNPDVAEQWFEAMINIFAALNYTEQRQYKDSEIEVSVSTYINLFQHLTWLDDQPNSFVKFLCFGSFGSFYGDQQNEIAHAIEHSGCQFLWSLRGAPPNMSRVCEYENPEEDMYKLDLSAGSASFEVPLAVWPMYAEQQMNAFLIVKDFGIAAEIKMDYKNDIMNENDVIVKSIEIEDGIRQLMQPDSEIRRKVKDLMEKESVEAVTDPIVFDAQLSLVGM